MFKFGKKAKMAALGAISMAAAGSAMADVPAAITTSITQAQADGVTVAGLVITAIVAIWAFKLMRRAL
ncbi:hypothetical protein D769_19288 [Cupriavidus sp. HMR-1]|uniref:major capsid protein n=1 Tax=Cupriavidus sp. HMR-1 TaxID=1249621 RepID=UPI0002A38011|nr:major capsid protein [Cupriavidus sp. HMR-1]EKZ97633.1 hypothetical protein D769_19288 [Cupriavidus sp. HMR-1]